MDPEQARREPRAALGPEPRHVVDSRGRDVELALRPAREAVGPAQLVAADQELEALAFADLDRVLLERGDEHPTRIVHPQAVGDAVLADALDLAFDLPAGRRFVPQRGGRDAVERLS